MTSALIAFIQPLFLLFPSLSALLASWMLERQGLIRQHAFARISQAPYTRGRVRNLRIDTLIYAEQRQLAHWQQASWPSKGTYRTKGRPQ